MFATHGSDIYIFQDLILRHRIYSRILGSLTRDIHSSAAGANKTLPSTRVQVPDPLVAAHSFPLTPQDVSRSGKQGDVLQTAGSGTRDGVQEVRYRYIIVVFYLGVNGKEIGRW